MAPSAYARVLTRSNSDTGFLLRSSYKNTITIAGFWSEEVSKDEVVEDLKL